jgi:hypothetical protein
MIVWRSRAARKVAIHVPPRFEAMLYAWKNRSALRSAGVESNEQSRLPPGERVRLHRIWLTECFPPSCVGTLVDRLEGIARDDRVEEAWGIHPRQHAIDARGGFRTGERRTLGPFVRKPTQLGEIAAPDLPGYVEQAEGYLEWMTPSLTVLTIGFTFKDSASDRLNEVLARNYSAKVIGKSRGIVTFPPSHLRRKAARLALAGIRRECSAWLGHSFPGAFAAGVLDGDIPSCLFLTLDVARPLWKYEDVFDPFQWSIGVDGVDETWESSDLLGLRLRVPLRSDAEPDAWRHWLIAGRPSDVMKPRDDEDPASPLENYADGIITTLGCTLGVSGLLEGYRAILARAGDGIGGKRPRFPWPNARETQLIRDLGTVARDIHPVSRDLATWDGDALGPHRLDSFEPRRGSFAYRPADAHPLVRWIRAGASSIRPFGSPILMVARFRRSAAGPENLVGSWISRSRESARRLSADEGALRDVLQAHATLSASASSLRLTWSLLLLTFILAGFTLVQVWFLANPAK